MYLVAMFPAAVAAILHVYIFVLESVLWTRPQARKVFGTTEQEAQATRELAFNQGFYNLFLAIVTLVGVVWLAVGGEEVGSALVFAGAGSMMAAALVLGVTSPSKRGAAIKQGIFPLITVVLLLIAVLG